MRASKNLSLLSAKTAQQNDLPKSLATEDHQRLVEMAVVPCVYIFTSKEDTSRTDGSFLFASKLSTIAILFDMLLYVHRFFSMTIFYTLATFYKLHAHTHM